MEVGETANLTDEQIAYLDTHMDVVNNKSESYVR